MLENSRTCLLAVQGPTQFIAGYIALKWYIEKLIEERILNITVLIYDIFVPIEHEKLFFETISEMALILPSAEVIFIGGKEMSDLSKNNYGLCKEKLLIKLGDKFDKIFIARDYGSFGTQLVINSYPNAEMIEYGDSFGLVGNEKELEIGFLNNPLFYLKTILKKVLYGHYPSRAKFSKSILAIPLDYSGKYLNEKSIIVPSRDFVKIVFADLYAILPDLQDYCEQLSKDFKVSKLYLLSNFSNSGFCTFENEFKLYKEIIQTTSNFGDLIILKNHPRASPEMVNMLTNSITDREFRVISDTFSIIPIEMWSTLIDKSEVFPIFSSSVISLSYLFKGNEIVMPMRQEHIEKYINKNKIYETLKVERMCKEAKSNLNNWDQKTVLWTR